jgi:tetratricopeptide (TPR) repeat protein
MLSSEQTAAGMTLYRQGQWMQAQALLQQVVQREPRHFEALYMLGMMAGQMGNSVLALKYIERAISVNPHHASAHSNLGNVFRDLGRYPEALASHQRALAMAPKQADAHFNMGITLQELNRFAQAVASYDRAIALKPERAEFHYHRGSALHHLRQHQAAVESYQHAISLAPDFADAHFYCGNSLQELNQFAQAAASYDQAIALQPDNALACYCRGNALSAMALYPAAISSYDQAIAIKPDYVDAHINRASVLQECLQLESAIAGYDRAITAEPDCAGAHWSQGLCYLQQGDFERGWPKYEWRWQCNSTSNYLSQRDFLQPLWLGEQPLQGKVILLHSEQGLGDAIQFARYAKRVHRLGARVILELHSPLVRLLARLEGVAHIVARGDPLPEFDYHCPLLSLPLACKTTLQSVPASVPYIASDPQKVVQWGARLGEKTKLRVGLVWSGAAIHKNDAHRSIDLFQLILHLPDHAQYISLQKEIRDADQQTLKSHPQILHFEEELEDFTDTAALCELMDLVISVDTSVAHLAGAMGKPVWILLPFNPDWRWLLGRADSPWYPSAVLYRQEVRGRWDTVLERIARDLSLPAPEVTGLLA